MLSLPFSDEPDLRWELTKGDSVIELRLIKSTDGTYSLDHIVNVTISKNLYKNDTYVVCIKKINSLIESLTDSGFVTTKVPDGYCN